MESNLLASGLGFPEGPTVLGDGRIVLCDGNTGELLAYQDGNMSLFASTGGPPSGPFLGTHKKLYLKHGGGLSPRRHFNPPPRIPPGRPVARAPFFFSH